MRLKLFPALLILLVIILLAGACTSKSCGDGEWEDITWILNSYGQPGDLQPVVGHTNITIEFNGSDKEISGSSGCNHYFGGYTLNSDCELEISDIGYTEMACLEEGVMEQEQKYLSLLQSAGKMELKDGELRITCGDEVLIYTQ